MPIPNWRPGRNSWPARCRQRRSVSPRHSTLAGATFRRYDPYGFPVDLTADIARERGLSVDMAGFDVAMTQQRETARAAGKFGSATTMPAELAAHLVPTRFLGYEKLAEAGLEGVAFAQDGTLC